MSCYSASGKTQLALQLSLLVQLPRMLGGVSGSACYVSTQSELETRRLVAIRDVHPLLSPSVCTLDDIQTVKTATIPLLQKVLKEILPQLIASRNEDPGKKPVKLVVIDSIADLFPSLEKTSSTTLAERAKNLTEVSAVLHRIAREHQIAVIVLNRTGDVFSNEGWSEDGNRGAPGEMIYRDQSRWFNRADSIHEERQKEAALGLVWANQVNVRVMFTRTTRRRYLDEVGGRAAKRRRVDNPSSSTSHANPVSPSSVDQEMALLRRLTVIFSSVSVPGSIDFILTEGGLSAPAGIQTTVLPSSTHSMPTKAAWKPQSLAEVAPLDVGTAEVSVDLHTGKDGQEDEPDWDGCWKDDKEFYENLDLSTPAC